MSSKTGVEPGPRVRRPWSLAARLTAWYAVSAFALVLVVTSYLYWALAASLDHEDDTTLARKVQVVRAVLRSRPGDLAAMRQEAEPGGEGGPHATVYVRLLDEGGRAAVETPGMGEILPPAAFPSPAGPDAEPGAGSDLRSAAGQPFRVLAARASVGGPGGPVRVVQVALDRTQEEELLAGYRRNLWLVLALALVGCALAGYWVARRGLRPVAQVTAMARRIRPESLGERLDTAGLPAELLDLAGTFNAMLGRLEESFGRLARFSADIAHELRTPLNNLRGEVEVALRQPRSPGEYCEALGSCLEECGRLSRMIDSLLFLARAENPRTQVEREPVDVGKELATLREFYEAAAAEAGVALAVETRGDLVAELNRPLLQRAVGNLVENALNHTAAGGSVTLTATREGEGLRVEVSDTGCGIDATDLPRLFDRFYRADRARSTASGGVGLGLAIVKGIAELHGGAVEIASLVGRGTRVALRFPARGVPNDGREG
jgi:two-component system heavy metal sensor histidine kinase CusS